MNEHKNKDLFNIYEEIKAKGTFSYMKSLEDFKKDKYYQFYVFLKSNRQVVSILRYNYIQLIKLVEYHHLPENHSKVWNEVNSAYRWRQQRQITMQLYNYLSSIFATIEFFRSNMREYISSNTEMIERIRIGKEEFFDKNPHHKFIQDLRNSTTHNSYLRITTEFNSNVELKDSKRNIYLAKSDLLERGKWSSLSKKFLDSEGSKIYIMDIIKSHYPLFLDFQNWCYLSLLQIDLEFTIKFRNELSDILNFAEKVNMARTSLPFNESYIRYLDLIIEESRRRCATSFEYSSAAL